MAEISKDDAPADSGGDLQKELDRITAASSAETKAAALAAREARVEEISKKKKPMVNRVARAKKLVGMKRHYEIRY